MKKAHRDDYGPPSSLSIIEAEIPKPKPNEILVRVHASTVNRTDCGALWGKPFIFRFFVGYPKPRHAATGSDFAGVIESVGSEVKNFKVGERIFGFFDQCIGSHAQYFTIAHDMPIATIPDGITFEQAAASLEGAHYAVNFLNKVKIKDDAKILINGVSGGIGSAMLQFLRKYNVDAVCGTPQLEWAKSAGAANVFDFTKEDFTKSDTKYDFIFDAVGKSSYSRCKHMLKPKGVYISSELGDGAENIYWSLAGLFSFGRRAVFPFPANIPASVKFIREKLQSREFIPLIDRTYPLENLAAAFDYVNTGQKIGSVLISFS